MSYCTHVVMSILIGRRDSFHNTIPFIPSQYITVNRVKPLLLMLLNHRWITPVTILCVIYEATVIADDALS